MNNSRHATSNAAAMGQPTRRAFVTGTLALALWPGALRAAEPLVVAASSAALGSIVAAVGGPAVQVSVDRSLDAGQVRLGGASLDAAKGLLLKGTGAARGRFLDDGRNAARVGKNLRDALTAALPAAAEAIVARHKAWSRDLAHRVLRFELALKKSPLRGKRLSDPHGRRYLLEWAGAVVDAKGRPGPKALASLPKDAARPDPAAYAAYLDALVQAVS